MSSVKTGSRRALSLLLVMVLILSMLAVPAFAAEPAETGATGTFINTSDDGGADAISLAEARSFKASIPVDMTEEEALAAAKSVTWSLLRDETLVYQDPELYPNATDGGPLEDWLCNDDETPLFTNIVTSAETVDGQVYLTVTFDSGVYFYGTDRATGESYEDASVPHVNGGSYTDVCGYFNLTAILDGEELGAAALKIAPYDSFHTMTEIYEEIDEIVAWAADNTDLYVEKFSMGSSQGDNGLDSLDMPYIIIAKSEEAVELWQELKEQAESDPASLIEQIENGELTDYQVPVMYSNIHSNEVSASDAILEFAWMLVETAASESGTIDYDTLTGFTEAGEAELAEQLGEEGAAGSVAKPDLVEDTATWLGYIKAEGSSVSAEVDLEEYYTVETVTVDIDELLDNVFFILVPEENVEGRTYLTRTSSGGFDLNRDNSFQTQAETQNMTALIAEWNPVSFAEFHGRVQAFQVEPCDPPHEPNFEYDLLAEHLVTGGEALGIAAVANNDSYNSYVMPQRDYLSYTGEVTEDGEYQTQWYDPWDDMSTSYTPQYAMLHGVVAYTVEVPAYNDDTTQAVAYGQLGQSDYIAQNRDSYFLCQLEIYERGVTNANSDAYELVGQWLTDQYDVEGAEADLFRPEYDGEGQNGNFYPECYIIPLDDVNQGNLDAADQMLEYLDRNGVTIMIADEAFTYDGVEYPAGTAVISMYQAKRSVANGVLYDGTVITEWPVLYSEGITAFNYTRGFDMITCAEPAAYEIIAAACSVSDAWSVESSVLDTAADSQVILVNASEDSTGAVNALLQAGKAVSFITEGDYAGSFLCSYADYLTVSDDYLITAVSVEGEAPEATELTKAPVVYICGEPDDDTSGFVKTTLVSSSYNYNYDRQAIELLGFTVTDDPAEADLILGASAPDDAALEAIRSGTAYIGYGSSAIRGISSLFEDGELVRETAGDNALDALSYVTYPTESLITASYVAEGDDVLYGYGAGYFASIPEGAEILIQLDSSKGLLEGFLPSTGEHYADFLDDSIQAISYQGEGADGATLNVVLFANSLTHKVHQRDEFNFISNAAFIAVMADDETEAVEVTEEAEEAETEGFADVPADAWYADEVAAVVEAGLMTGYSDTTFAPLDTTSRAMLVTVLYRMDGSPEIEDAAGFADVAEGSWYETAVDWAYASGVTTGLTEDSFAPTQDLTRQQAVTFLYRYLQLTGVDVSASADLSGFVDADEIADYAQEAMSWAVAAGVVTGTDLNELAPADSATRAELAALILRVQSFVS